MRKRHNHRHRGFVCQAGLWSPQVELQITPFCWGLGLGFSRNKFALQVGPVAIAIWFPFRGWKAQCYTFNDPKV